ncbi:alcohol dehydrogenase catalytic domain-containing protein [Streptomyces sp. NPDC007905]|uniref:alcohol dehydrogenase catalytic domain-containing protein n=1 Tax=Streptomyces sp. NPDC007905 TaxID=3364788 RepID=UPI0036E2C467
MQEWSLPHEGHRHLRLRSSRDAAHDRTPRPRARTGRGADPVKAFGLNHAEAYMRAGTWGDVAAVPGIECAGLVEADPSGQLAPGTRVVAILGGRGRTRNGSCAELVTVPATNVAAVNSSLGWAELAAVPEGYATAWNGLFGNLDLRPGERVLVRGATSSLGQAAVNSPPTTAGEYSRPPATRRTRRS